jgi:DNA-binding GntR family transcriptional regulator
MQITQHYRELINSGQLKDGDRVPSARQIVEQWGVAHATAAKVLSMLRTEGLVTTTPGGAGGTVVHVRNVGYTPQDRMSAVRRWSKIYPPDEHARIVSAERVDAPAHVAEALGVELAAPVIRRHRVTYRGDTPVSASTSWFDGALAEVAPLLLVEERIPQGTPGYVGEQTGRMIRRGQDQVSATAADEAVAAQLQIAVGSPVLRGRNWARDDDGDVVEFGEYVSRPDRWQIYEYELA